MSAGTLDHRHRTRIINLALYSLATAFLLAAGLCVHLGLGSDRAAEEPVAIAPVPGASTAQRRVLAVPMFKQWDPAWGDDELGGSGEKMRFVGCTVSCVAMTFKHYGLDTDPKRINAWLRANDGYTAQGWLKWDKCVEYAGRRVTLDYVGEPDAARMRRALAADRPVIVRVLLEGGVNHWVLAVGTEGDDYLVNDPLNLAAGPARLSDYGPRTYAMRIFSRKRP